MMRSLYTAATGMDAQQLKMDTIANNLANANTTAFKKARPEFQDLLSEQIRGVASPDPRGGTEPTPLEVGLGVKAAGTTRTYAQGDMLGTGAQYDLAIQGAGFFQVQRPSGDTAYTRAGNLRVDATGRLVTPNGELVQPPITVPTDATAVVVKPDGSVEATVPGRTQPVALGALELANFQNPAGLASLGNNLYGETVASGDAFRGRPGESGLGSLQQGYLEGANVKAVEEMVDMISTQRAYELNSKVIQTADQMLQRLTSLR
jgi:flagellar basal-body rod protein FlgG